jgi:SAM-dependent methyltransferase
MKDLLLRVLTHPLPLRSVLTRKIVKRLSLLSYEDRLILGALDRPHYGYCIYQAAKLAKLLNYPRISVVEFGCGGGNGLLNAEMHIAHVIQIFGVDIELYGFDTGSGLPAPRDYRDLPHYFQAGLYHMDRETLERKLERAKLVIGDIGDTCAKFFDEFNPAPIGCMLHDLDFYSATRDALTLLDAEVSRLLPRIFMYFDDIIGDDVWLCNEYTGERLAMIEFNKKHPSKKIDKIYYLPRLYPHQWWTQQIYAFHDFHHPKYDEFVAGKEQIGHEAGIKLR